MMPVSELSKTLHQGFEQHDISAVLSLYSDNAELKVIDRNHSPSRPLSLMGKPALESYFKDLLTRPVTHHIEDEVISDNHYAYTERCDYPDGSRVFTASMATLEDGKIVREVEVTEWDENP